MPGCKMIHVLYDLLPLKVWRGFLIHRHVEVCPSCQDRLAAREEARSLLVQAEDVEGLSGLWPKVRLRLKAGCGKEQARKPLTGPMWRWAVAVASLMIAVVTSFWLSRGYNPEDTRKGRDERSGGLEINYIRVGGETANTIIYQPKDSDLIVVWAGKGP